MKLHILTKKAGFVAAVAGAAVVGGAATAIVQAAVPSSADGQIHACYRNSQGLTDPKGALRVIDTQATPGQSCSSEESELNFNQTAIGGLKKDLSNYPYLNNSNFAGMTLSGVNFSGSNLNSSSLRAADMRGADFRGADLTSADLTGAVASDVDFTGGSLDASILSNANLRRAKFSSSAQLTNGTFDHVWLLSVNLTGANLSNSNLSDARMTGSNFTSAVFYGSNLTNADMTDSSLTSANVGGANLTGANTSGTDFTGVTWVDPTYGSAICPDATDASANGDTCAGHLVP